VTGEIAPLERAVLDLLLSRSEEGYGALRAQVATATVAHREVTGAGFYTDLWVDRTLPASHRDVGNPLGEGRDFGDDVYADIEGLEHGAGFLLWLEDGWLSCLEGFSYAEPWPDTVSRFSVRWERVNRV
jgi:hypothetical protein